MKNSTIASLLALTLLGTPACIVSAQGTHKFEDATVREVLPLQYASCDDLAPMLRNLIPENKARILSDTRTNSLVVMTDKETFEQLRRLVAKLDVEVK